jgi:hypothetical protein
MPIFGVTHGQDDAPQGRRRTLCEAGGNRIGDAALHDVRFARGGTSG